MAKDSAPDLTGQLRFESDKGAGASKWIAIFLGLALIGWMGSGYIIPTETADEVTEEPTVRPVAVAVIDSAARDIELVLTAEGQSTPDRSTGIQAKASGQMTSVLVARGDLVAAGQELGRIDSRTIEAQLAQAQAQLVQATEDYDRAVTLQGRGIATENQVTQTRAAKVAAEAAVTAAQEQLDNTIIRAPFAGRLNEMTLDVGEFVNDGDVVAEVLDNDPLTVVVQVPQQALSRLEKGQEAQVSFITGETRTGTVGFIGSNADSQTRTFRVEVTVDNPDSQMPAGLSARIVIPTGQARGHFISPAILSLSPTGELGIKTVLPDDTVAFRPIMIVRAQPDGIWVTGLEDETRIITVGQGFVNAGDVVDPRPAAQQAVAVTQ
ncbi:efflux RND transporter periplasmic adaptor subunit [Yoonia sp. SDW83-1]|uniref:efflux RND transporter periplasmic adaptor subunit n=1 Tax=Yoonia sp. SDW83-1 TaxID=3366945 RepID=UPI00398C5AFA